MTVNLPDVARLADAVLAASVAIEWLGRYFLLGCVFVAAGLVILGFLLKGCRR